MLDSNCGEGRIVKRLSMASKAVLRDIVDLIRHDEESFGLLEDVANIRHEMVEIPYLIDRCSCQVAI